MQNPQIKQISLGAFNLLSPQQFNQWKKLPKNDETQIKNSDKFLKENFQNLQDKIIEILKITDKSMNQDRFNNFLDSLDHLSGPAKLDEVDKQYIESQVKNVFKTAQFQLGILKKIAIEINRQRVLRGQVSVKLITVQAAISKYIYKNKNMLMTLVDKNNKPLAEKFLSKGGHKHNRGGLAPNIQNNQYYPQNNVQQEQINALEQKIQNLQDVIQSLQVYLQNNNAPTVNNDIIDNYTENDNQLQSLIFSQTTQQTNNNDNQNIIQQPPPYPQEQQLSQPLQQDSQTVASFLTSKSLFNILNPIT